MNYTKKYDNYFKKYTKRYFSDVMKNDSKQTNLQLQFKAQGLAESNLKEDAKSYVGATGIMQLMPNTFKEECKILQTNGNIYDPEFNIRIGIHYNKRMFNSQTAKRPFKERLKFMFASYNAGLGTILNAQKYVIDNKPELNQNLQQSIVSVSKDVPKQKQEETISYVCNIFNFYKLITDEINENKIKNNNTCTNIFSDELNNGNKRRVDFLYNEINSMIDCYNNISDNIIQLKTGDN